MTAVSLHSAPLAANFPYYCQSYKRPFRAVPHSVDDHKIEMLYLYSNNPVLNPFPNDKF